MPSYKSMKKSSKRIWRTVVRRLDHSVVENITLRRLRKRGRSVVTSKSVMRMKYTCKSAANNVEARTVPDATRRQKLLA